MPSIFLFTSLLLLSETQAKDIFTIALSELESLVKLGEHSRLDRLMAEEGALAVVGLPPDYASAVSSLKSSAPRCLTSLNYPQFYLPDGSQRRTFATESEAHSDYPACIRKESETISSHLDTVDSLMSRLITAMAGKENLVWRTHEDTISRNFSSAQYKEHIHVYEPLEGANDESVWASPFHTDNGLMLMITPFREHPLQIKDREGRLVNTAKLGDDSLLVLVASGLPDWLLHGTQSSPLFFPVPHAVPSLANDLVARTVFARMKVVPLEAFPCNMMADQKDKKHMFQQFFHNEAGSGSTELCPMIQPQYQALSLQTRAVQDLMETQCQQGAAWCWMNCLPVPSVSPCQNQCVNKDRLPCCTVNVTENCENMDDSCHWAPDCQAVTLPFPVQSEQPEEEPFCRRGSGTDMYMKGFTSSGKSAESCVILLFTSWVLDTRTKFAIGCVGVILLGIAIEAMLCVRRELQSRKILLSIRGPARRASIIFLFGVNIVSGYLAMLVAMTYSVELFVCMVVGLVAGHAVFNAESAVGESVDPCCASQAVPPSSIAKGDTQIMHL